MAVSTDRRGVAPLVGYLLVFATVLGGAVVLTTLGIGVVLDSAGQEQHLPVLERLDRGAGAVADGSPYRQLGVDPRDASLTYGDSYTVRITASGGGVDRTGGDAIEATGQTLRYEPTADRVLAYEAGLIADRQAQGTRAVVRAPPDIDAAGSRLSLVLPTTVQSSRSATLVASDRGDTVPVVLRRVDAASYDRAAVAADGSPTTMNGTITVEGGAVPGAWGAYFERRDAFAPTDLDGDGDAEYTADTDGDGETDVAGCAFETQRLYVRTVTVGVGLGETL
jgi:hypothetical protein